MKNTTISLPNLFNHTPKWASGALTIITFLYGVNALCIGYDLYSIPAVFLNKITGAYTVATLVLLSFGAKKPTTQPTV